MANLKKFLVIGLVAVVAVWAWNKFIAPRTGISA
jgi:hypothetical protein